MSVVIAIDAGTTGVRSFAVRQDGSVAGYAYREFPQHFPQPGWVEHDPRDIWDATTVTLDELIAGLDGEPVAAFGITNQRETAVAWDRRTGEPLHNALVWQDRRTAKLRTPVVPASMAMTTDIGAARYWVLGKGRSAASVEVWRPSVVSRACAWRCSRGAATAPV